MDTHAKLKRDREGMMMIKKQELELVTSLQSLLELQLYAKRHPGQCHFRLFY